MKMNYLQKNNQRNSGVLNSFIGLIAIVLVVGILYLVMPNFVAQTFYKIGQPLWGTSTFIQNTVSSAWPIFSDKAVLEAKNNELLKRLDDANINLTLLENYKKENEELKNNFGRSIGEKGIIASVLNRPNHTSYDSLIVDVGSQNGIQKDDLVYVRDFVVGRVQEVFSSYSKVSLLSSSGEKITVRIGDSGVDTDALGRGGGNFYIKIPRDVAVKEGDVIKSTGLYSAFYGIVGSIEQNETSSFQFILFTLPINMNSVDLVEIVHSPIK